MLSTWRPAFQKENPCVHLSRHNAYFAEKHASNHHGGMTAQQELIISRLMPTRTGLQSWSSGRSYVAQGNASELFARKSLILTALKLRLWGLPLTTTAICPSASTMSRWGEFDPGNGKEPCCRAGFGQSSRHRGRYSNCYFKIR